MKGIVKTRITAALVGLAMVLAACEDEGNPGNDNLLTGFSLVIVLVIVAVIAFMVMRRRST
jgi:hypothetical protein